MDEIPHKTVVVFTHGDAPETQLLQMFDENYTAERAQDMIVKALGEGRILVKAVLNNLPAQDAATLVLMNQEVDALPVNSDDDGRRLLSFTISSHPEEQEVRQALYDDVTDPEGLFFGYIVERGGETSIDQLTAILFIYVQCGEDPSRFSQEAERYASSLTPNERSILLMLFHVLIQKALPAARLKVNQKRLGKNFPNN
jgi:hypothetical protein